MIQRTLVMLLIVLGLVAVIAYSQYRPRPDHVSGVIEADEIRVGSRVGGRVERVLVQEGQRVARGEILIALEPYDLLQRENEARETLASLDAVYRRLSAGFRPEEVSQAKARYDQFQAQLDLLQAGPRSQEIEAARGRLQVAEAELTLARQNFQRVSEMFEQEASARADFDAASEQLDAAQGMLVVRTQELQLVEMGAREEEKRAARARVEEARQAWQLAVKGYRQEEIDQAKAARDAAQAALESIREQKKELVVTAPVNGVVEALDLQQGDLVPPGAPVLSILDDSHLWVRAYVPENRVGLQVGQRLRVTIDAYRSERFSADVTFISREAEFTPANVQTAEERAKQVFRIKVALRDGLDRLRPGMSANVWLNPISETP